MVKILSAIGVSLLTCVHGAVDSDLVTELPGFGKLPSKHYSGEILHSPWDATKQQCSKCAPLHYQVTSTSLPQTAQPMCITGWR